MFCKTNSGQETIPMQAGIYSMLDMYLVQDS